jgi:hypothetical protein
MRRASTFHSLRTSSPISRRTVLRGGIASSALAVVGGTVWGGTVSAGVQTTPATPIVTSSPDGEWPAYGRDAGGMRHAPLT